MKRLLGILLLIAVTGCSQSSSPYKKAVKLKLSRGFSVEAFKDFECLGINVVGTGISSQIDGQETEEILTSLKDGTSYCSYPGASSNFIKNSGEPGELSFEVIIPKGEARILTLMAVDVESDASSASGSTEVDCSSLTAEQVFNNLEGDQYQVYNLGSTVLDILDDSPVSFSASASVENLKRIDCVAETKAPISHSLDMTGSYTACITTDATQTNVVVYSGVSGIASEQISIDGTSGTITVTSYTSTDCSGPEGFRMTYVYGGFTAGSYQTTDETGYEIFNLDTALQSITLNSSSSYVANWSGICSPTSILTNTDVDMLVDCSAAFPYTVGTLFYDIVAKSGTALHFGTIAGLGVSSETNRPSTLKGEAYAQQ